MMRLSFLAGIALLSIILASSPARADRILMIGDSLSCGPFGRNVVANWKKSGHEVTLFCAVSSRPENWLNGTTPPRQICQTMSSRTMALIPCQPDGQVPKLDTILARHPADRIVVALGTNSLHLKTPTPAYVTMASAVRAKAPCQWIGPPHLRADQAIGWSSHKRGSAEDLAASRTAIAMRETNLSGFVSSLDTRVDSLCPFIDSRAATASGPANETNDGIHKGPVAGRAWADALRGQLARHPGSAASGARSRPSSR